MMRGQCRGGNWRPCSSWLLQYDFRLVSARRVRCSCFILCALFNALLPAWKLSTVKNGTRKVLAACCRDKRFVRTFLTLTGVLHAGRSGRADAADHGKRHCGHPAAVKWMYAIEACLSDPILTDLRPLERTAFSPGHRLMAGLLLMTLSMMPIGLGNPPPATVYADLHLLYRLHYCRTGS